MENNFTKRWYDIEPTMSLAVSLILNLALAMNLIYLVRYMIIINQTKNFGKYYFCVKLFVKLKTISTFSELSLIFKRRAQWLSAFL